jgi:fibronectin-binding autotransporter adhesin
MKKLFKAALAACAAISTSALFGVVAHAAPGTCIWTGSGPDNKFSTAANWTSCDALGVPESGDALNMQYNAANTNRIIINDIVGLTLTGIDFTGGTYLPTDSAFGITGSDISLSGILANTSNKAYQSVELNITLNGNLAINGSVIIGAPNAPGNILDIGASALDINVPVDTSTYLNSDLVGSGAVTFTGTNVYSGLNLYGDNSQFGGSISTTTEGILFANTVDSLGDAVGSTTIGANTALSISSCGSGFTLPEPIILNGASPAGPGVKISFGGACAGGAGYDELYGYQNTTQDYILSGPLTLGAGVEFGGVAHSAKVTGPISGTFGITWHISSGLIVLIQSSANGSASPNGTYSQPDDVQTLSDSAAGVTAWIRPRSVITVTGTRDAVLVSGGTLKGTGTLGTLDMTSGTIAPGMSPGCLTSGNITYTGGTLEIEINGAIVCTQYDQQVVNGTVSLGSATTLNVTRLASYAAALNSTYTIINNDSTDAVSGSFVGLAEGATFSAGGYTYKISYVGGSGNDVVLTVTAVPAVAPAPTAPNTGFRVLQTSLMYPVITLLATTALGAKLRYEHARKK